MPTFRELPNIPAVRHVIASARALTATAAVLAELLDDQNAPFNSVEAIDVQRMLAGRRYARVGVGCRDARALGGRSSLTELSAVASASGRLARADAELLVAQSVGGKVPAYTRILVVRREPWGNSG